MHDLARKGPGGQSPNMESTCIGTAMGLRKILSLLCLCRAVLALNETCIDYKLQFERVFSVPGDIAMLSSTLLSPSVFNHTGVPYNISWYNPHTGRELGNRTGQLLVWGDTLWLLNVQPEDAGKYVTVVRTPFKCFRQTTQLVVEQLASGSCRRPWATEQVIDNGVNGYLSCPLKDYIKKLKSYSLAYTITWHKECTPIVDGSGRFNYDKHEALLKVKGAEPRDRGNYTCTLTFALAEVTGSVSEAIEAKVKEEYSLDPEVHEPANVIVKAEIGGSFNKTCRVFVPCVGPHRVLISWSAHNKDIPEEGRVFRKSQTQGVRQEFPKKGVWLEAELHFTKLLEEDFNTNYTCYAFSSRGRCSGYFTLLPADPNILLPIGLVFCGVGLLFIASGVFYYMFKIDIVLWFRRAFPVLSTKTDSDGKLYDAYVTYPRQPGPGASRALETFAFHTLPQVLEERCGYKLFIAGRDCLPGQATADSVEEGMRDSRSLLLLYTASSFTGGAHNNNNIPKGCRISNSDSSFKGNRSPCEDNNNSMLNGSKNSDASTPYRDDLVSGMHEVSSDITSSNHNASTAVSSDHNNASSTKDWERESAGDWDFEAELFERDTAMHRALMEGSLKVVLVELEEISPRQLALLPESVRHLRQKEGAVCWWKSQRAGPRRGRLGGQGAGKTEGPDMALSASLSPSSRFWKELRYRMPMTRKGTSERERLALLAL